MIELTDEQADRLRAAAELVLQLVADPRRPVHARDPDFLGDIVATLRGTDKRQRQAALCHRGGNNPRLTDTPHLVTCGACKTSADWDAWRWQRTEEPDP